MDLNSEKYWEHKFNSGRWEENKGNLQTIFHYEILVDNLPTWLKTEIIEKSLTIGDLGSSMGEGVNILKNNFEKSSVTGVDFSKHAINESKKKYSNINFVCADITKFNDNFDVIISSHVLEHFEDPYKLFKHFLNISNNYLVILLPFNEKSCTEHLTSFNYDFFPLECGDYKLVFFKEIEKIFSNSLNYTTWEQILVIYGKKDVIDAEKIFLNDLGEKYFYKFMSLKKKHTNLLKEKEGIAKNPDDLGKDNKKLENEINSLTNDNKNLLDKIETLEGEKKSILENNDYLKNKIYLYKSRKSVRLIDNLKLTLNKLQYIKKKNNPKDNVKRDNILKNKSTITYPKKLKEFKVAVIMDSFSYHSFKYEFNPILFTPDNWLDTFEKEKPDLFLCESAWTGFYNDSQPWIAKIYHNSNYKFENDVICEILDYCKDNNIPSIFWNKEDPIRYYDDNLSFKYTASKFDHIFTTAKECVPLYKEEFNHNSVNTLIFAAQPKMFNPIELFKRSKDIVFAGSWYDHHSERCNAMDLIFNKLIYNGYNIKIYDRNYGNTKLKELIFPKRYNKYLNPSVSFENINKIYKESYYGLNLNTITESHTMFARRVFELMASNTLVLSNYSIGIDEIFSNNVIYVDNDDEIDLSNCEKIRLENLYNVLENHTYTNRFKETLDKINMDYKEDTNQISIYYVAESFYQIKKIVNHFNSLDYEHKILFIVLKGLSKKEFIKSKIKYYNLNFIKFNDLTQEMVLNNNDSNFLIFTDIHLRTDFIRKGLLHYSYIDDSYGIALGDNFTFKEISNLKNVIVNKKHYNEFIKSLTNKKLNKIKIYTCKM